jgi:hypothetical protein
MLTTISVASGFRATELDSLEAAPFSPHMATPAVMESIATRARGDFSACPADSSDLTRGGAAPGLAGAPPRRR